jgi:hypothetical protein
MPTDLGQQARESVQPIVTAFKRFSETGDESFVLGFSRQDMERAQTVFSSERGHRERGWYITLERRLERIYSEERHRKSIREKWKDRAIGFFLAIISGGILMLFKKWL